MSERLRADADTTLLALLKQKLEGWSGSRIKSRLKAGCVLVNGEAVTHHAHPLTSGDDVEVLAATQAAKHKEGGLPIVYSDKELVGVNKPPGLVSVSPGDDYERTALTVMTEYLSRPGVPQQLWAVHRVDRDTSGVILFAKSKAARDGVMAIWGEVRRTYLVIVDGGPNQDKGRIDMPMRMDERGFRALVGRLPGAQEAVTEYRVLRRGSKRTLLDVRISTAHQHQIRAHLAWLGCPVSGDGRYGQDGFRLALHSHTLTLPTPDGRGQLVMEAPMPKAFENMLR
ncbi:MAG: 23S rRNA pseudouridine1911/1915/1917 synthase [Bradymonadia bacterium]|jgi:23S rRNA pseudouridine1911/1915/1917 synthase